MYKYIFLDLDETLLDFKSAEATAIATTLKKFGISPDNKTVELYSKINLSCWKRYEKGEISRQDIYKNRVVLLGEKLGVELDVASFSNEYFSCISRQGQILPFSLSLLKSLKQKGYIMAAATNGAAGVQISRIVNSGLAGFFGGGIFISEQIGFKKPEPEFFYYMLDALGIKNKGEVLVIGDSQSSDIKGAVLAGLESCFVNTKDESINKDFKPTYTVNSLEEIISVCNL